MSSTSNWFSAPVDDTVTAPYAALSTKQPSHPPLDWPDIGSRFATVKLVHRLEIYHAPVTGAAADLNVVDCNASVCVECLIRKQNKPILFKVTEPSSIPYRTHPACCKMAAYPDPPPVILVPESIAALWSTNCATRTLSIVPGSDPARNVSRYWDSPRACYRIHKSRHCTEPESKMSP